MPGRKKKELAKARYVFNRRYGKADESCPFIVFRLSSGYILPEENLKGRA
jgi:hypothetical protein